MDKEELLDNLACLADLLAGLRACYMIHQSHHWQSAGKTAYADHLLFQRLYEGITPEIDIVGEKLVAFGGIELTNYFLQQNAVNGFMKETTDSNLSTLANSLSAEKMLLEIGADCIESLKQAGVLTTGLENAIAAVLDKHEEHLYLLQQRVSQ